MEPLVNAPRCYAIQATEELVRVASVLNTNDASTQCLSLADEPAAR